MMAVDLYSLTDHNWSYSPFAGSFKEYKKQVWHERKSSNRNHNMFFVMVVLQMPNWMRALSFENLESWVGFDNGGVYNNAVWYN